ncbi:MAG: ABC-F family ATP-binding cassette domain-containing protein [Chloroflexi bacterium]|nr:ABC-F family ATP-binding cassette domain-containing protein [Chloroflexota bacterium]
MLTLHKIHKSYAVHPVLSDVSFSVSASDRVGLVGPNGCGKSTLLRIAARAETPDSGHVQYAPAGLRVGYLAQGLVFAEGQTIGAYLAAAQGLAASLDAQFSALADALARAPDDARLQRDYEAVLERLAGAEDAERRAADVIGSLGLGRMPSDTPIAHLSGGQKTRLALAGVLLGDPELLLLDEPTNHLDLDMLDWLEAWLNDYRGAAVVVSHDRMFLDETVRRIVEIDPHTHGAREYAGNYSGYVEQKEAEQDRQWAQYRDEQAEIKRMRQDIAATKEQARWVESTTTSRQPVVRRYAKKVARKALSREKKLDRYVESDERAEKPLAQWQMKLAFGDAPQSGQDVLVAGDLAVGYDGTAILRGLNLHIRHGERVVLSGENGAGKTTLLRTIAGLLPPVAGILRLGANVRVGFMAQEQEALGPRADALSTIRSVVPWGETDARNFLHFFLFAGDEVFTPVHSLSYGERARLMLATLVARGCNFLLLDEPLNHLDIPSRARFEQALAQFDGTVLAVSHDRYFIAQFATRLWTCDAGIVREE